MRWRRSTLAWVSSTACTVLVLFAVGSAAAQSIDYIKIQPVPQNNLQIVMPTLQGTGMGRIIGGGIDEHSEQLTVFGYNSGPNGIPEDGAGDDIGLGPVPVTWSTDLGTVSPTGLWTAPGGATGTGSGTVTASTVTGQTDSITCVSVPPDWVPNIPAPIVTLACDVTGTDVTLSWSNPWAYDSVQVKRNGAVIADLPGGQTLYTDLAVPNGAYLYELQGIDNGVVSLPPAYCNVFVSDLVIAQFEAFPTSGGAPLLVQFTDLSLGAIDTWFWEFGDGTTSTDPEPLKNYEQEGLYTVSLTVSGPNGDDTETKVDYIDVGPPVHILATEDATGFFGQVDLTVPLNATSLFDLDGFAASLSYPGDLIDATDFTIAGTITEANGAEFVDPQLGDFPDAYLTLEVIMDFLPPFEGQTIPSGTHQVASMVFDVNGVFTDGETRPLEFIDGLGPNQVVNHFDIAGNVVLPVTVDATLTFFNQPVFVRGACNDDSIVAISDAVFILSFLFVGGPAPSCFNACDANDDNNLNLPDAVYILSFLFVGGPPPPPPFPDPGVDPTPGPLPCG